MADSTINDADLMRPYGSSNDPYYASLDAVSAGGLIADTNRQNSPKRPSLDERLEKELGIKMGDGGADIPDFSKPPPGYPAVRLIPQASVSPHVMPGAKLGHIPSYSQQENKSTAASIGGLEAAAAVGVDAAGRHLRVGNMLQIVPNAEQQKQHLGDHNKPSKHSPKPVVSPMAPNSAFVLQPSAASSAAQEEIKAKELLRKKLEEQKKQKEAERRLRREQRLAELQKKELEAEQNKKAAAAASEAVQDPNFSRENKKQSGTGSSSNSSTSSSNNNSSSTNSGRILETIEREEEDHEARILAEAMTSVPDDDHELNEVDEAAEVGHVEVDVQGLTSAERRSKSKNKKDQVVRYISLKPLSKKERKRQAKNLEAAQETIEEFEEEEEDFVKRSPVPLPDSSTVKSILHAIGYSSSKDTTKKVLKYADGVLPGQGSPDHHNDVMDTSPPALQSNR